MDNLILIYQFTDRGGKSVYAVYDCKEYMSYLLKSSRDLFLKPEPLMELRLDPPGNRDENSPGPTPHSEG